MVEPDPWKINENNQRNTNCTLNDQSSNVIDLIPNTFEDNFQPENSEGLPDSKEYLQSLEKKLRKLRNDSNILDQLKARREQCMEHLLQGELNLDQQFIDEALRLDEEFESNRRRDIVRHIQPEQPLNLGELIHIINHDHLNVDNNKTSITDSDNSKIESSQQSD